MADNYVANAGTGGNTFASDDIGSVHYPRVKLDWGTDGVAVDTSVANPLPVQAVNESNSIMVNGVAVTPKFAAISSATIGNNTLVAAVTSKKIRVISMFMVAGGAVNVTIQSGASGTGLTGAVPLVANTGFVLPRHENGWFESASGVLLNMSLSAAVQVSGAMTYIEV